MRILLKMHPMLSSLSLLCTLIVPSLSSDSAVSALKPFHPDSFPKNVANCKAINRHEGVEKDIQIQYVEVNSLASKTIVMVHGWPGLWTNWAHQILEFQDDYHIIAPDQRGFGASTHPGDVEASGTMGDLVADLVCVLKDTGVNNAICLGHDWGAQVCWEAARMRPDIFEAVATAVLPYIQASGPFTPTSALVGVLPRLAYQLYFQDQTATAIEELDKDVRKSLRAVYRSVESPPPDAFLKSTDSFLEAYGDAEIEAIPYMTKEEEDYLVEQYSIQGFKNTLQFYTHTNRYAAWELDHTQANYTIHQPALSILPTRDPVADWAAAAKVLGSAKFVPNLATETLPTAHWIQLEKPVEFNAMLRKWLDALPISGDSQTAEKTAETETEQKHFVDEL
ncbi:alpha/beta-hydrolase [Phellopilus nigrolimitatus]|nr:alpha/beta-hydrolase [Phellopilus nigrolimitatus]